MRGALEAFLKVTHSTRRARASARSEGGRSGVWMPAPRMRMTELESSRPRRKRSAIDNRASAACWSVSFLAMAAAMLASRLKSVSLAPMAVETTAKPDQAMAAGLVASTLRGVLAQP